MHNLFLVAVLMSVGACSNTAEESKEPGSSVDAASLVDAPAARDLRGQWELVEVGDGEVPEDVTTRLTLSKSRGALLASWDDGLNLHSVRWALTENGHYRVLQEEETAVGCAVVNEAGTLSEVNGGCSKPGGLGVTTADRLGMDDAGRLAYMTSDGETLAIYKRAG